MENVDEHVAIIDHHPLARWVAVHVERAHAVIFAQLVLDFAADRFQMRFGGSRANHEKVRDGRDAAQVERQDILRLFVRGKIGAERSDAVRCQLGPRSFGCRRGVLEVGDRVDVVQ